MSPGRRLAPPSSTETAVLEDDGGEQFSRQGIICEMDGSAVFNFVQVEVLPMIEELLRTAGVTSPEEIDFFLFHQPNWFMLQKLADKMKVLSEKMPNNIVEHYGNASGVTIPMAICHNLRECLSSGAIRACFAGFGVGLTWASLLMRLGPLNFCDVIEFP